MQLHQLCLILRIDLSWRVPPFWEDSRLDVPSEAVLKSSLVLSLELEIARSLSGLQSSIAESSEETRSAFCETY